MGGDPLSGANGRALLFDLDKKFDEQDRLIKYLMQQQASMEDQMISNRQANSKYVESSQQSLGKIENQMRYASE